MTENSIATTVINAAMHAHKRMGPGPFEAVYEVILAHELRKCGLRVERQVPIPIVYDDITFDEGFRAGLIVEDLVIVELKSIEALLPVHGKKVLTQCRLSNRRLGLLINFGEALLKNGIKRIVIGLPEDKPKL